MKKMLLGNLSVKDMEKRLGVTFSDECKDYMNATHQNNATKIQPTKWHCFELPFTILCGDMLTAETIQDYLKDQADEFKVPIGISVVK